MPFPAMGETLDFMQKMWGMSGMPTPGNLASMAVRLPQQMPSMIAPTVDIEELDKRIADLRAVEQWLELNASMLRTTIQTLEVQRATIATLKGISGAMMGSMFSQAPSPAPRPNPFAASPSQPKPAPSPVPEPAAPPHAEPVARAPRRKKATPTSTPKLADDALNPAAWWHTLQDQFSRIAAVATDAPAPEPTKAKRPARRTRKKA
jgi:hypothetical protein